MVKKIPGLPALLNVREVAEALRVHENTVYKYANDGTLKPIRLGNPAPGRRPQLRFRRSDIERLLETEQTA